MYYKLGAAASHRCPSHNTAVRYHIDMTLKDLVPCLRHPCCCPARQGLPGKTVGLLRFAPHTQRADVGLGLTSDVSLSDPSSLRTY